MEEVEELLKHKNDCDYFSIYKIYRPYSMRPENWEIIENLINKYKEQEKMIELMAEYIDFDKMNFNCSSLCVKERCREECIINYFRKKAKGE